MGKSVAPTCLWQWDSRLVVRQSSPVGCLDGKRDGEEFSRCRGERFDKSGNDSRVLPSGLKMSAAGKCPHPDLSNLA